MAGHEGSAAVRGRPSPPSGLYERDDILRPAWADRWSSGLVLAGAAALASAAAVPVVVDVVARPEGRTRVALAAVAALLVAAGTGVIAVCLQLRRVRDQLRAPGPVRYDRLALAPFFVVLWGALVVTRLIGMGDGREDAVYDWIALLGFATVIGTTVGMRVTARHQRPRPGAEMRTPPR